MLWTAHLTSPTCQGNSPTAACVPPTILLEEELRPHWQLPEGHEDYGEDAQCYSRVTIPSWEEEEGGAKHPSDTVTIIEIVMKITAVFITDTVSQLISTISTARPWISTYLHARVQTTDIYHRTLNSPDAHHKINNNKGNRLFWMHFIPKYMDYYCQHYSFG